VGTSPPKRERKKLQSKQISFFSDQEWRGLPRQTWPVIIQQR